jgi:hypothetical protein
MTTNHRIISSTLAIAAAMALGAGAAPASARPYDLNGSYLPAGQVAPGHPSSNGSSPIRGQGAPPILPAPTPSQSAGIQRAEQHAAQGPALPKSARYSNAEMNAYPTGSTAARATIPDSGFDWGNAGIGAASGFAIALLGVGGGLALSQRRSRRPRNSALVTG